LGASIPAVAPVLLVVDPDPAIRRLLEIGLGRHGFVTWLAGSAEKALDLYRRHPGEVALVLLEVCLPGTDGIAAAGILRALDPAARFCYLAGDAGGLGEADLLATGAAGVARKPFRPADLAALLWRLVGRDRRTGGRIPAAGDRVVLSAPGAPAALEGRLADRSPGGLGLRTPRPAEVGSDWEVAAGSGRAPVRVRVRYCRADREGYTLGCQFVGTPGTDAAPFGR
jgi:CheY-like chemotaxis protein